MFLSSYLLVAAAAWLGGSRRQVHAAGHDEHSCASAFGHHQVFSATIYYQNSFSVSGTDQLQGNSPMSVDRNTLEYRTRAFAWYKERYGLDFDPAISGIQPIVNNATGTVVAALVPTRAGQEATSQQVLALDAQGVEEWEGKFPLTNLGVEDDGYFLTLQEPLQVTGGSIGNITLPALSLISYGDLRLFLDDGTLVDTIVVKTGNPAQIVPPLAGSTSFDSWLVVDIEAESPLFGSGNALALAKITPLNLEGDLLTDIRYSMRFQGDPGDHCDNYDKDHDHDHLRRELKEVFETIRQEEAVAADSGVRQLDGHVGSCDSNFTHHEVYPATILYHATNVIPSGGQGNQAMAMDRNTLEYRTRAFAWYKERYGLDFDVAEAGTQAISDASGNPLAYLVPSRAGTLNTSQQVYGLDLQGAHGWEGKFPMTNVGIEDDGYFLSTLAPLLVEGGTYGNVTIPAMATISYGDLRLVLDDGDVVDTILVKTETPAQVLGVTGSFGFRLVIDLDAESTLFGKGNALAHGSITPINQAGDAALDLRYYMQFPGPVTEPECDNYAPPEPVSPTASPTMDDGNNNNMTTTMTDAPTGAPSAATSSVVVVAAMALCHCALVMLLMG